MAKFKIEIEDLTFGAMRETVETMVELLAIKDLEKDHALTGDIRTDYKLVNAEMVRVNDLLKELL